MRACDILGTSVAVTDYREVFETVSAWALEAEQPYLVEAANTHVVALARQDKKFRQVIDRFDLVLPDGMPLVWVLNRRYKAGMKDRVYGPTLMKQCMEWSQEPNHRHIKHFLLGSTPETVDLLCQNLRKNFPKANIVGRLSPPIGPMGSDQRDQIIESVQSAGANFVWTCFGCPKQESLLADLKPKLPNGVYYGIGAAFGFHAGVVKQAPGWMQKNGLEWLFRLAVEPRRLWKRYLVNNVRFVWFLALGGK